MPEEFEPTEETNVAETAIEFANRFETGFGLTVGIADVSREASNIARYARDPSAIPITHQFQLDLLAGEPSPTIQVCSGLASGLQAITGGIEVYNAWDGILNDEIYSSDWWTSVMEATSGINNAIAGTVGIINIFTPIGNVIPVANMAAGISQMVRGIEDGVYKAFLPYFSNRAPNAPAVAKVYLDGRLIASATAG